VDEDHHLNRNIKVKAKMAKTKVLVYDWPHSVWTKSLVCKDVV
jgi:hypothetical protein